MKTKRLLTLMVAFVLIFALTACGNKKDDSNTSEDTNTEDTNTQDGAETADLEGTIVITGSTSVEKILLDMIDEFTALNPDVTINYTGTGSSAGITDTIGGLNTMGVSSREVKEEETSKGVVAKEFAFDGIAVVVNPANEVKDISVENLAKIYSGEITNWNQVGGADGEIVVVSREGSSGTRSAFEELVKLEDAGGLEESATVVEGNGNVQTNVAGNKNAIGYVSFSFIDETVKALTVGGVEATAENAKTGDYVLSRPFLFVFKEETLTNEAKAFLEYAVSEDGQAYVEEHGGIRID